MKLIVDSHGNGPDLVMLHGWGFSSQVFAALVAPLSAQARVHLIDLPGYGRNRTASAGSLTELADAVVDAAPEGATLCGWSLGGQIALSALARRPKHFSRLILVASTPRFVAADDWQHGIAPLLLAGFHQALRANPATLLARFGTLINQGDTTGREITRLLATLTAAGQPEKAALDFGLSLLRDLDLRPLPEKVPHPTLVIHGDKDPLMPVAGARWLAERFPHGELELLPDAAHAPFLSDPERFVARILRFLAPHPAPAC